MIRILAALVLMTSLAFAAATPSPNLSDQQLLASDTTFMARVTESLITTCNAIASEAISTTMPVWLHIKRSNQCALMVQPTNLAAWHVIVAQMVATDSACINDATVAGTVSLTSGNVAAQAALVTDAHIGTAISSQFNMLLTVP
jgi:hypothetical protein